MPTRLNKKTFIIGGGFSATIASLYSGKFVNVISFRNNSLFDGMEFLRRKEIECNKFFSKKSSSIGTLNFKLNNSILHDRMVQTGNSSVWGGKIDLSNLDKKDIKFLEKKNIYFRKISYDNTGTISNNQNIYQIQNSKGKIFESTDIITKSHKGMLINFFSKNKKIFLKIKLEKNSKIKIIKSDRLILCVGSVQLLDLLYRSNLIKNGDKIELSEFKHKFKFKSIYSKYEKKAVVVRYHISRAIGHYFGIQFYSLFLKFFKFVPFCIDQIFYFRKIKLKLKVHKNSIVETTPYQQKKQRFGDSIHYCNLKINNIEINKFLANINPNIIGLGMSFINQKKPGPISNEIILDVKKKCRALKI